MPDEVRRKALGQGAAGEAWLRALAGVVDEIAGEWGLAVGDVLTGGTEALVIEFADVPLGYIDRADGKLRRFGPGRPPRTKAEPAPQLSGM